MQSDVGWLKEKNAFYRACQLFNIISMVHPLQVIHIAGQTAYTISKNLTIN